MASAHQQLRILFLANYAPLENGTEEEGHYPSYHREICGLLRSLDCRVLPSREGIDIYRHRNELDYVFSLLNRLPYRGSEVFPSALAEYVKIPYLGASPHIRALADDKYLSKLAIKGLGFNVPSGVTIRKGEPPIPPSFPGPYFIKPRSGAASRHVDESSIQESETQALKKAEQLLRVTDEVLIEEFSPGTNLSLPIIGGNPPLLLKPYQLRSSKPGEVVTEKQKRRMEGGLNRSLVEDGPLTEYLHRVGLSIYQELGPIDYLRVEFRYREGRTPQFTEFNVCANIGSRSGFAFSAAEYGITHRELISRILSFSLFRQKVPWNSF